MGIGWSRQVQISLGLTLSALFSFGALAQQGGPPLFSIRVAPAEKVTLAPTIEFTGSIEPWREIEISTQVAGLVDSIPIEEGERLEAGDLICHLDSEETEILIARHEAMVASASAELLRLETGFLPEEIEEAGKNVEAAKARQKRAQEEWDRYRPLVAQGVSTKNEGTEMEAAFYEAEAELRAAEARLRLFRRGYRDEQILKAKADVDKEKADLAEINRQLKNHLIAAPTDCVVVERLGEPGEWIDKGAAVARVVVLNPLRVRIEVPQTYLTRIRPGQTATLRVDGKEGRTFEAKVEQIVPRAGDATRNFPVLMRLENPDYFLSSGLFARVELRLEDEKEMIAVPREAVLVRDEGLIVLVADPAKPPQNVSTGPEGASEAQEAPAGPPRPKPDAAIRAVSVRLGNDVGDSVVVEPLEGGEIRAGDEVVVLGGTRLRTGMPAKIIRDVAEPVKMEAAAKPENASE
ncbi:MAG: efflux RND transporter periplasmic adaptor subunit [Candidatus Omnitrophica bacterium]|nr:efflux RND transporter periplasmic adaptor subunit [Candidatus Omnitrophota bacterium]MCA9432808.1 efflux RND transporter periplasmic adaptor subunit [Candidatus Omnitrophota bacterium]MCB9769077.1 efflux RND transporter periplasmic adaptor subunit [Candidatus Omnitrophota bacterium]MCB9783364.1 efflux RND transporter periplasmic adaptor subunit [Candidatus Omnitrophota bacterium]